MFDVLIQNDDTKHLMHDGRPAQTSQKVISANVNEEKNAIGSLTFTIYPNNSCYDLLTEYKTRVTVERLNDGKKVFSGRVLQIVHTMDNSGLVCKNVTCETRLGYLQDSVLPYRAMTTYATGGGKTGLEKLLDFVLTNHNTQVETEKALKVGNISLIAYQSTQPITVAMNYEKTFDFIKSKVIDVYGGEIRLREESDGLYLDIADQLGSLSGTAIELSKNMLSASFTPDPSGVITKLIPLGAKINNTDERLTISSVNSGRNYIEDSDLIAEYGKIVSTQTWDDITDAAQLKATAQNWLTVSNRIPVSISVSALDLFYLNIDADDFRLYDRYRIVNPLLGVDTVSEIVKSKIDINAPYNSSFEMGSVSAAQTSEIITNQTVIDQSGRQSAQALSEAAALSADYAAFRQDIEQRFENTGDYIAETGTVDGWKYSRRNSGVVECWKTVDFGLVDINIANGSIYIGNTTEGVFFPFAFDVAPNVSVFGVSSAFSVFSPTGDVTAAGVPALTLFRPTAAAAVPVKISFYVIGSIPINQGGD